MKKKLLAILLFALVFSTFGCAKKAEKLPVKVLLVPHFEIGEMKGDAPGEAQLLFEEYFKNYDEYLVSGGIRLYYNPENDVAMYISGVGKVNAAMSTTSVLNDSRFDFSSSYILAVGCSGGATGYATLGDVIIESAVCDYDVGHTADIRDLKDKSSDNLWFASDDCKEIGFKIINSDAVSRAYDLTKDIKLKTTDISRNTLTRNFPNEDWAMRDPAVIKGTSVSSDNYWKGQYNHDKAVQLAKYYKCPDPYASTEMEDISIVLTADRFGMLERTLVMRVAVNIDMFFDNATPESLWGNGVGYFNDSTINNEESLDIFVPGMENLFITCKPVINSILSGEF